MNRLLCLRNWLAALALGAVVSWPVFGQQERLAGARQPVKARPEHRRLAPGVVKLVNPARQIEESYSRHNVVELLAVDPQFDWAKEVAFRHDVWALEFRFKPMRMIWVDVPQPSGQMRRKLIWYMVYSVRNPGKVMHPVLGDDGTYKVEYVDRPIRFIPEFLLEGHGAMQGGKGFTKVYPDRVIPVALGAIRLREDRTRRFYNSVEICGMIPVGQTVWGVATWEDIDPRIDRFSVYIQGLTNAYRWRDKPGSYKKGDPIGTGRRLSRKTLKLNFWRPGDEYFEHEREIRYGIPGGVDYEWVYR